MEKSTFVYVTFIRTTPEKLWAALTQPEFTRQFFFDTVQECEWTVGSPWKIVAPATETVCVTTCAVARFTRYPMQPL